MCEIAATAVVVIALTIGPTPGVNESHYLTKARRFWEPNWCAGDLFLDSPDAHWLFCAVFGWPTQWLSLDATAWAGRIVCWWLVAWAWWRLARRLGIGARHAALAAGCAVAMNRFGNMAGEWFVGGCEAKVVAYGLLLVAWERAIAATRLRHVALALGAATAFHPVVALWGTAALAAAGGWRWLADRSGHSASAPSGSSASRRRETTRDIALASCLAVGLACVGIVPALAINWQTSPTVIAEAHQIQVLDRLAHHQWPPAFPITHVMRFLFVVVMWGIVARATWHQSQVRVIHRTAAAALGVSLAGAALAWLAQHGIAETTALGLLRLYWFRLADVVVPISMALGIAVRSWPLPRHRGETSASPRAIDTNTTRKSGKRPSVGWPTVAMAGVVVVALTLHIAAWAGDPRPGADRQSLPIYESDRRRTWETYENWRAVCHWIAQNTPLDARFLTPLDQQTFKWYAGRAEVVAWKDAPQDAASLVEWQRRMVDVHGGNDDRFGVLTRLNSQLVELAQRYDADYLVVAQRHVDARIAMSYPVVFEQVYPASSSDRATYVVFRVRPDTMDR